MSAERLRPQAERALRRTATRGVQRDVRVEQERNVVAARIEVALVDVDDVRQRIEIGDCRAVGIVNDLARSAPRYETPRISLSGLPLAIFHRREVELAPDDEIDRAPFLQGRLLGQRW